MSNKDMINSVSLLFSDLISLMNHKQTGYKILLDDKTLTVYIDRIDIEDENIYYFNYSSKRYNIDVRETYEKLQSYVLNPFYCKQYQVIFNMSKYNNKSRCKITMEFK